MLHDELDESELVSGERPVGQVTVEGFGRGFAVQPDEGADEESEAVRLLAGPGDLGLGAGAGLGQHGLKCGEVVGGELVVAAQPLKRQVVLVVA